MGMGRTWGGDGEDMGWGRYTICASSGYNPSVHTLRMQLPHLYTTLDTSTPTPEAGSTWILSTLVAAVVWAGLHSP